MTDEYLIPPDKVEFFSRVRFVLWFSDGRFLQLTLWLMDQIWKRRLWLSTSLQSIIVWMLYRNTNCLAMKEKNPVDNVRFYRSDSDTGWLCVLSSNWQNPSPSAEKEWAIFPFQTYFLKDTLECLYETRNMCVIFLFSSYLIGSRSTICIQKAPAKDAVNQHLHSVPDQAKPIQY